MPVDNSTIKQQIDTDLGSKGYRGVTVAAVIRILKSVADWVQLSINTNLITWLRLGSTTEPPLNGETAYRTGRTILGRSTDDGTGAAAQLSSVSIGGVRVNPATLFGLANTSGLLDVATLNWDALTTPGVYNIFGPTGWPATTNGPRRAFQYGTLTVLNSSTDNAAMMQIYISTVGDFCFRCRLYGGFQWYYAKRGNAVDNKLLALYDVPQNDHQFYGFGIGPGQLQFQVEAPSTDFVWRAGTSPATSVDVMRLKGNGMLLIGQPRNPTAPLLAMFTYLPGQAGLQIGTDGTNDSWLPFVDGRNYLRGPVTLCDTRPTDNVGVGVVAPTSKLHVNGAAGHNQFRLEKPYTPTSSSDPNGEVGQVAWDANWSYQKVSVSPHIWKRSPYNTW